MYKPTRAAQPATDTPQPDPQTQQYSNSDAIVLISIDGRSDAVVILHHTGCLHVPSKAERVANFHAATLHAALEIVGALGVDSPSQVSPHHLYRRESGLKVKSFASLQSASFPSITTPGVLLSNPDAVPSTLRQWWEEGGAITAIGATALVGTLASSTLTALRWQ